MRKLHAFLIVFSLITVCPLVKGIKLLLKEIVIEDFQFESGESLSKLNLHYRTIGKPTKGLTGKLITQY
jgi:homoserine O-acetyltransferase